MATLVENKNRILQTFANIKAAIIAKGQTPSGNVDTYADAISAISGGGGTDVSDTTATAAGVLYPLIFHTADGEKTTGAIETNTITGDPAGVMVREDYKTLMVRTGYYKGDGSKYISEEMLNVFPVVSGEIGISAEISSGAGTDNPIMSVDASVSPKGWGTGDTELTGSTEIEMATYAADLGVDAAKIVQGETILGVEGTAETGKEIKYLYGSFKNSASGSYTVTATNMEQVLFVISYHATNTAFAMAAWDLQSIIPSAASGYDRAKKTINSEGEMVDVGTASGSNRCYTINGNKVTFYEKRSSSTTVDIQYILVGV